MFRRGLQTALFLTTTGILGAGFACTSTPSSGERDATGSLTACALGVTQNTYDAPNYWGTLSFKNNGSSSVTGFSVEFDVPSGAHCTNDAVPPGATLSPLTGSGSSA